jgi:hypothetical protein
MGIETMAKGAAHFSLLLLFPKGTLSHQHAQFY